MDEQGFRSPARNAATGRAFGNRPFSRGQLYKILSNPTYIARIDHGGRSHAANFSPIIEQALWDDVQARLAANINAPRSPAPAEASLLAGKLVDDGGVPMIAVHASKGKVRYRYYVSRDLHYGGDATKSGAWRLPAPEIEPLVRAKVAALLNDPIELFARSGTELPSPEEFEAIMARGKKAATKLAGPRAPAAKLLRDLVAEVPVETGRVGIVLNTAKLASLFKIRGRSEAVTIGVAARLKRSGMVMRPITHNGGAAAPTVDRTLAKAIVQVRSWWQELQTNTSLTLEDLARREGITAPYVVRIVRLAFLSPRMLKSIVDGTRPAHLTVKRLTMPGAIPARWDHQFV